MTSRVANQTFPVKRLKYVVDPRRPITYGIVQCGPDYPGGVPYIRPADMTDEGGVEDLSLLLRTDPEIAAAYVRSTIAAGDLVISIGPSFGKVMAVPPELAGANLTQGTARVAVRPPANTRFVFWALRSTSCFQHWESSVGGATFRALNLGPLAETPMPMPTPQTQRAIADYLDRETARLDTLVAAKERVLGLLTEKRRALITRAVNRGLDPRTPLRDSGIPWLGEVPAHWTSTRLRFLGRFKGGTGFPHEEQGLLNEDLPFFKVKDLSQSEQSSVLTDTDNSISYSTAERLRAFVFPAGTIVFAKVGAALLLSRFRVLGSPGCIDNNMMGFMVDEAVVARDFALTVMRLLNFAEVVNPGAVPSLNEEQIGDQPVTLPPPEEQQAIVACLRQETAQLDRLVEANARTIALLKERRAALIAAAVTGQLEVA